MARTKNWDPAVKRQQILDAAIAALNRRQLHDCLVDDIARQAGIAKGTVYLYFKSKEDLYGAVLCELIDRLQRTVAGIDRSDAPAPAKLRALLEALAAFFADHRRLPAALQYGQHSLRGAEAGRLRGKFRTLHAAIGRIVGQGIAYGVVKPYPAPLLGTVVLSLGAALARHNREAGTAVPTDMMFAILMDGIARPQQKRAGAD
jgi:TetR/AcrR family fatty acid metabolism transcriptional regulator